MPSKLRKWTYWIFCLLAIAISFALLSVDQLSRSLPRQVIVLWPREARLEQFNDGIIYNLPVADGNDTRLTLFAVEGYLCVTYTGWIMSFQSSPTLQLSGHIFTYGYGPSERPIPSSLSIHWLVILCWLAAGSLPIWWTVRRVCREWLRSNRRDDACRKCGYLLIGNVSGTCPECGTPVPPSRRGPANAGDIRFHGNQEAFATKKRE